MSMSRTEQLRNKLRSNKIDKNYVDFLVKFNDYLEREKSALSSNGTYNKRLFDSSKDEDPADIEDWLRKRLEGKFTSDVEEPVWPSDADWCFHDDEPMVFVHQFKDAEGVSFFIFRHTGEVDGVKKTIFKMISYDRESKINMPGYIG